ncbi:MAG: glutamate--tRNA ligase [Myxococcaceae bacterium]|nr:MAG: glutamate--tRNA ligase [Myxococcaceae bacterium]
MATPPRVRFAPSPTGYLHIGGARTALFNWLEARRDHGRFVLRIEDTDRERSTVESVQAILDGLRWLGLDWDEGPEVGGPYAPYFQTDRLATYRAAADRLVAEKKAYLCYCTKEELEERRKVFERQKRPYKYEGTCRNRTEPVPGRTAVVRFRMPDSDETVTFEDRVIGKISKQSSDLDDFVMLRADGIPLYNFGAVVDDHGMEITLVIRGQEHINSTFPQLLVYRALGWKTPDFAHLPLILGPDREKLSKRRHPEADVMLHRKNGILPEALLNFIVRLGWSHGNEEIISREQMVQWFGFDHVGSTSGVWNPEKLLWLNQHYLKTLPEADVAQRLLPFLAQRGVDAAGDPRLPRVVVALRERSKTLVEMAELARPFFVRPEMDPKAVAKHLDDTGRVMLRKAREALSPVTPWAASGIDPVLKALSESEGVGMGKVAQPIRVAVTGSTVSPPIGETLELLGKDETLERIDAALR